MATAQTITILFTDMVGSTALSSALDPEAADKLRQEHFSLLRKAVAASEGTEVKNLGDGLMVAFASPSAAVACAVAMQQEVERDNRRSVQPLGLRVGLSCGEVTAEDGDYFGDPVVEAARLCAQCEGGQVLSAELVRLMAGRRSPQPFTELGLRELKGMPEPVLVYEIGWVPVSAATGVPVPERLERGSNLFGFSGRQTELEMLLDLAKEVAAGTPRVAFVSGEPGIGKTSLCRAVVTDVHERGMCVLYGRCDEDLSTPYQPFAEALSHFVIHADEELLRERATESGGALLTLVPALSKRLPDVEGTESADPDSERLRLFSAVVSLCEAASSDGGLLLVLDDLHWADKASLQLLRHVASSPQLDRVMVLGTYRDSELSAGNALSDTLASLRRQGDMSRISLSGLDDTAIVEMMEVVAGHAMDERGVELAYAVRQETEGNPFFTTELLRHLAESGLIRQDDSGRWVATDALQQEGLPQSVREVVGQRVDRLGEETRRVLSHAAVIGRDFDIDVLAAITGLSEDAVLDIVDASVSAGLLAEVEGMVERFTFCHALTQHTLYADLGATRRARIHRKTADVLEQLYDDASDTRPAELARHFVAATKAVDVLKAIIYSKKAGEQALRQSAPVDAVTWFAQALALYPQIDPDAALHCDVLIGLGTAQCRSGDPAHRQTLLDAAAIARDLGDASRLVEAALANSRGGVSSAGVIDTERLEVLDAALDVLAHTDSHDRALLLATKSAELSYIDQPEQQADISSQAIDMARRLGDPATLLRVMALVYHGYVIPDNVHRRLEDLGDALEIASMNADPAVELHLHNSLAIASLQAADRHGFDQHAHECARLADQLGQPFEHWTASVLLCNRALLDADADQAETYASAALAVGGDGVPEALTAYGVQLIEIRRLQGRAGELSGFLDVIAKTAAENPGLPVLQVVMARMYCDLDRLDDARQTKAEAIALGTEHFPYDYAWLPGLCNLATVCVDLGLTTAAGRMLEWLLPWSDQVASVGVTCQGPVALYLGMLSELLGDHDGAATQFRRALEISEELRAPNWVVHSRLGLAATLEHRDGTGDLAAAAAQREAAQAEAVRHDLEHLLEARTA